MDSREGEQVTTFGPLLIVQLLTSLLRRDPSFLKYTAYLGYVERSVA